jgi:hypothetical protein
MYSPARYIEKLVSDNLKEFFDNHNDVQNSISIGLLRGQLKLNNLVLKKREIPIGENYSLSVDYGVLQQLIVEVPWAKLHSGNVKVVIKDMDILVKLKMKSVEEIRDNRLKTVEEKMVIRVSI